MVELENEHESNFPWTALCVHAYGATTDLRILCVLVVYQRCL